MSLMRLGLVDAGLILPVGTVIVFPLDTIPAAKSERKVVRLWD